MEHDKVEIGINGFVTHALQLQGSKVRAVQLVEAILIGFVHGKLLENAPRLGAHQGLHRMHGVFCRGAASFNKSVNTDRLFRCAAKPAGYAKRYADTGDPIIDA